MGNSTSNLQPSIFIDATKSTLGQVQSIGQDAGENVGELFRQSTNQVQNVGTQLTYEIGTAKQTLSNEIGSLGDATTGGFNTVTSQVSSGFSNASNQVSSGFSNASNQVSSGFNNVTSQISNVQSQIGDLGNDIQGVQSSLTSQLNFNTLNQNLYNNAILSSITQSNNNIASQFGAIGDNVDSKFGGIEDLINNRLNNSDAIANKATDTYINSLRTVDSSIANLGYVSQLNTMRVSDLIGDLKNDLDDTRDLIKTTSTNVSTGITDNLMWIALIGVGGLVAFTQLDKKREESTLKYYLIYSYI